MSQTKSKQARACIELLCQILDENGFGLTRAETFRQAKFDNNASARSMGMVLLNAIHLCDTNKKTPIKTATDGERMVYIKETLQQWGYLSLSFAQLPHDFSVGSREFLLALGWVIYKKKLMDKLVSVRSNPLHQSLLSFVKNQEQQASPEGMSIPSSAHEMQLPIAERVHYHMMLTGKLRMSLRRMHSAYQQSAKLIHMIHRNTEGLSLQTSLNHLTPLEVYVIRHPGCLKRILEELERDNTELSHFLEWKQKEVVFWEWMESVLTAHVEDTSQGSSAASTPRMFKLEEETLYLRVHEDIGDHLENVRSQLRDTILAHEEDMSRIEHILQTKKTSQMEMEFHRMHLDKELTRKAQELRNCAFAETDEHNNINMVEPACLLDQTEPQSKRRAPRPFEFSETKEEVLSPYALKAARNAALKQKVQQEISKLRHKVAQLSDKLQQTQLENMQKVQGVINMDASVICIQPRVLKQSFTI